MVSNHRGFLRKWLMSRIFLNMSLTFSVCSCLHFCLPVLNLQDNFANKLFSTPPSPQWKVSTAIQVWSVSDKLITMGCSFKVSHFLTVQSLLQLEIYLQNYLHRFLCPSCFVGSANRLLYHGFYAFRLSDNKDKKTFYKFSWAMNGAYSSTNGKDAAILQ